MAIKHQPMLCESVTIATAPTSDAWVMEPKYDGWRFTFTVTEDETRSRAGRNSTDYTGVPALQTIETVLFENVPAGTVLDGELVAVEEHAAFVSSVLANPRVGNLRVHLFDMPQFQGQDIRHLPWDARRTLLVRLGEFLAARRPDVDVIAIAPVEAPSLERYHELVAAGGEGVVFKRRDSKYRSGRSGDWRKLKATWTADVTVTGFVAGRGKFANQIGAIQFELDGVASQCSGMTDEVRHDMTDHPERWIGKTIEIRHNGLFAGGVPRHPQFIRRRDDLDDTGDTIVEVDGVKVAETKRIDEIPVRRMPTLSAAGTTNRNYAAMGPAKLEKCIAELRARAGDAYERAMDKNADIDAELTKAESARRAA